MNDFYNLLKRKYLVNISSHLRKKKEYYTIFNIILEIYNKYRNSKEIPGWGFYKILKDCPSV